MTSSISRFPDPRSVARKFHDLGIAPEALVSKREALGAIEASQKAGAHGLSGLRSAVEGMSPQEMEALRTMLSGLSTENVNAVRARGLARDNLPEVKALLAKYEPRGPDRVERPQERILAVAAHLDRFIMEERDPDKLVDRMMDNDIRRHVFLLEGQMRMYRDTFGPEVEQHLTKVKELEDALGACSLWKQLGTLAQEKGFPAAVVENLQKKQADAREALRGVVKEGWIPDEQKRDQVPVLNRLIKTTVNLKWPGYDKDRKQMLTALAEQVQKAEKGEYDMNDLQGGLHEFRRDLRWVPIYAEAVGGLIRLSERSDPIPALRKLLEDPLAQSKYVQLPPSEREMSPVSVSKTLYVAMMKAVLDLGGLKDRGEQVEFLAQACKDAGVADSRKHGEEMAEALLGAHDGKDIHEEARRIQTELIPVLKMMRSELEDAR